MEKMKVKYKILIGAVILVIMLFIASIIFMVDLDNKLSLRPFKQESIRYNTLSHNNINELKFDYIEVITSTKKCISGTCCNDEFYIITDGGIIRFSKDYNKCEKYTVNNGFLSHSYSSICQHKDKVYIGLEDKGIVSVKNNGLTNFIFEKPEFNCIECMHSDGERLYLGGNFDGILILDSRKFRLEYPDMINKASTIETNHEGELVIGTQAGEIFLIENNKLKEKLGNQEGLPDGRINDIIFKEKEMYVATNYAIYSIGLDYQVNPVIENHFVNGFVKLDNDIYAYTYSGEIINLNAGTKTSIKSPINGAFSDGENCYFCTNNGLFSFDNKIYAPKEEIPGTFITSVSLNEQNGLICGTFENGIFYTDNSHHITGQYYSEFVRQVNHIYRDESSDLCYVSTTDGIGVFKDRELQNFIEKKDGLISNYVSFIFKDGVRLYAATGSGLSIIEKGIIKNMYAFHGLINNHTYTIAKYNNKIYIGTLGGISTFENDRITNNYSVSDSKLESNWITALLLVENELWIGTYGKGLYKMDKDGNITHIELDLEDFEVNNNAIYFDGKNIFVGTLDIGLLVVQKDQMRYDRYIDFLPSPNVTAIIQNGDKLYLGTDKGIVIINRNKFSF
ncbi:hypothetical protein JXI42_00095 [bacterium]|nr:hypothetical protein [bacterium]